MRSSERQTEYHQTINRFENNFTFSLKLWIYAYNFLNMVNLTNHIYQINLL